MTGYISDEGSVSMKSGFYTEDTIANFNEHKMKYECELSRANRIYYLMLLVVLVFLGLS